MVGSSATGVGVSGSRPRKRVNYVETTRVVLILCLVYYHNNRIFEPEPNYNHIVIHRPEHEGEKEKAINQAAEEWNESNEYGDTSDEDGDDDDDDDDYDTDGIDWFQEIIRIQDLSILQAGLNLYMCLAGVSFSLSMHSKRKMSSVWLERTKKLLLVFFVTLVTIQVPTRFFVSRCKIKLFDGFNDLPSRIYRVLTSLLKRYQTLRGYHPGHLAFLPYLFILTLLYFPMLYILHIVFNKIESKEPHREEVRSKTWAILGMLALSYMIAFGLLESVSFALIIAGLYYIASRRFTFDVYVPKDNLSEQDSESNEGENDNKELVIVTRSQLWNIVQRKVATLGWGLIMFGVGLPLFFTYINTIVQYPLLSCALFIHGNIAWISGFLPIRISVKSSVTNNEVISVNLPLMSLITILVSQIAMLLFSLDTIDMPDGRNSYGKEDINLGWFVIPYHHLWGAVQMAQSHGSFFMFGFLWQFYDDYLPGGVLYYKYTNTSAIMVNFFSVLIVPLLTAHNYPDFRPIHVGYFTFTTPTRRFLYALGGWVIITLCIQFNKKCGNEPFKPNVYQFSNILNISILTFLKDANFYIYIVHPFFETIIGCYLKQLKESVLSWVAKFIILQLSVYLCCFIASFALLVKLSPSNQQRPQEGQVKDR